MFLLQGPKGALFLMIEVALYAHNPLLGEPSRTTNNTVEVDTSSPLVSRLIQPTLQNWNQDSALSPTPFTTNRNPSTNTLS